MGVNTSEDDFMPPSGLGKDKGRAVVVDGVVESSESVAAARWFEDAEEDPAQGKDRADEVVVGQNNDIDDETDDETHRAPGGATFCHHCRSTTRQPKMRCTLIKVDGQAMPRLFCDCCIETRTPS